MPLYEYRCRDCDGTFEAYVRAWGETVRCPSCESASVDKLLSTFAFASAGGGSSPAGGGCGCGRGGCGCRH
ncbi:MAG TPA: zinc ribbon domain-containing protein [Vicinamibacteria bacterium]|nr:zinc ribbon domain-containing protein [Vicinamibacteria bacterium]